MNRTHSIRGRAEFVIPLAGGHIALWDVFYISSDMEGKMTNTIQKTDASHHVTANSILWGGLIGTACAAAMIAGVTLLLDSSPLLIVAIAGAVFLAAIVGLGFAGARIEDLTISDDA